MRCLPLLSLSLLLWGCSGGSGNPAGGRGAKDPDRDEAPTARRKGGEDKSEVRAGRDKAHEGPPKLVLLIVMDTVRADHLSACGYAHPTSPNLQALVERGAQLSCQAYSPAPWTLPSHASYFTGQFVTEHGMELAPESKIKLNDAVNVRPLGPEAETLAESFAARGYQTLFLSGNPIIKAETGLHQGFELASSAEPQGGGLRGRKLEQRLQTMLERMDPTKPLFAFVNLYDAHDPYPAIPKDVPWLPARAELRISPTETGPANPFYAFHNGTMEPKAAEAWLAHARDTYDWGIAGADRTVDLVMKVLRDGGYSDEGVRMVITSDHGEMLGEHGWMRHGGHLHEGVVRVPFLWFDNQSDEKLPLPPRFSAVQAHSLLLHGRLDEARLLPTAMSTKNPSFFQTGQDSVGVWAADDKLVSVEGTRTRFDLAADPAEERGGPAGEGELLERLKAQEAAFVEMNGRPVPENGGMTEALRAMGYVE
jgi:arylsulfatase A-like enzyme